MNSKPNMTGISRYWKKREDDRVAFAKRLGLDPENESHRNSLNVFLEELWGLIKSRRRTKFVGFGVFEWKKWNNRIPTGKRVETWRLTFKPGRYVKGKYNGSR